MCMCSAEWNNSLRSNEQNGGVWAPSQNCEMRLVAYLSVRPRVKTLLPLDGGLFI